MTSASEGDVDALGDARDVPVFFFNDPATSEIFSLPLLDALPICNRVGPGQLAARPGAGGVAVLDRGERAQGGTNRGLGSRNRKNVGAVYVVKNDNAAVGQVAVGAALLGAEASHFLRGAHRPILCA